MNKSIIDLLVKEFPSQDFYLEKVDYLGTIYAFVIISKTEEILNSSWEKITNMIGLYFQSKLESEFEIWNIYLFFLTTHSISKDLKYKIEHDIISSRKIVIDCYERIPTKDLNKYLISEHITNDNLAISSSEEVTPFFSKNKKLSSITDKINIYKGKWNKEELLENALNQLELL